MEYLKKDIGSYKLHLIKTKKFKTITVRVTFRTPIVKDEITIRNILCDMFTQSSKNYPSKRDLTIKAQDLYSIDITTSNTRLGNYNNMNFYLSSLNDKYTETDNFKNALEFFSEIIFNPDINNNKFNKEKLDIVKTACKNTLLSIKEDTTNYSLIRLFETMDKNRPSSYRMVGYLEDLEKINEDNLYTYYKQMLKTNLVDIFVIGDIDFLEITDLIRQNFKLKTLKKQRVPYILEDVKVKSKRLIAKEEITSNQSKLAIGCRLSSLTDYERNYPLTLYNIILGGGTDSKLFQEVREKNSLCYVINSVPNKLDNLIIIRAGIDKSNYQKVLTLVDKILVDMKKGKFTEENINKAKEFYNTALDEVEESQNSIINNYYMSELIGTDSLEVKREKIAKVTKEEIVKVAKKVKSDTIFLLEGNEENNNVEV